MAPTNPIQPLLLDLQLRNRLRSFMLTFCGGFVALLAAYLAPMFPGPVWSLASSIFWIIFSAVLVLGPSLIGLFTPPWPAFAALMLGAVLGFLSLQALLFSARAWGPFDALWFKWLFFG